MFSILLRVHIGVEWLGPMVIPCLTFEELLDCFPKGLHHFTISVACSYLFKRLKRDEKEKDIS